MAALDWGAPDRGATTARLRQPLPDYILAADCCYVDPGETCFERLSEVSVLMTGTLTGVTAAIVSCAAAPGNALTHATGQCSPDPAPVAGGPTPDPEHFVATAAELVGPETQLLMAHEVGCGCCSPSCLLTQLENVAIPSMTMCAHISNCNYPLKVRCRVLPGAPQHMQLFISSLYSAIIRPSACSPSAICLHQARPHGDAWPALEAACQATFSRMEALPLHALPAGFRVPHIQLYRLQL